MGEDLGWATPERAVDIVVKWIGLKCGPKIADAFLQARNYRSTKISGGITNTIHRVTFSPAQSLQIDSECSDPELASFILHGVSVRFYGCTKKGVIDRQREAAILDFLGVQGMCKRSFFRFLGGEIDEWRAGRMAEMEEMKDFRVAGAIACHLARLHSLPLPKLSASQAFTGAVPRRGLSHTWEQIFTWLHMLKVEEHPSLRDVDLTALEETAERVLAFNDSFDSPRVLCHNDLLNGNIVIGESTDFEVDFIDFEYAGIGERGFDIANHFCEMAGFNCDWSRLPNREFKIMFLSKYLQTLSSCPGGWLIKTCLAEAHSQDSSTGSPASSHSHTDDILPTNTTTAASSNEYESTLNVPAPAESYVPEIDSFMITSHLFWGLWALVQSISPLDVDFDYAAYARRRLAALKHTEIIKPLLNFEQA